MSTPVASRAFPIVHSEVAELTTLAISGLKTLLDPQSHRFSRRFQGGAGMLAPEPGAYRYSLICLLGIQKWIEFHGPCGIELQPIFHSLVRDAGQIDNVGDLGLLLWATSVCFPERTHELCERLAVAQALSRYPDAQRARTMELSWFLTGLSFAGEVMGQSDSRIPELALQTYRKIAENQGPSGIFGHQSRQLSLASKLRGRVGTFADQVYPILAFTRFAHYIDIPQAITSASACAHAICEAQGNMGQWWWHYDSESGQVTKQYPVYSVHQHGMGPMALLALSRTTGEDFAPYISRGLHWISGQNELSADMVDRGHHLVWRCIRPQAEFPRHLDSLRGMLGSPAIDRSRGPHAILRQCWSYELGWLLYAWADAEAGKCLQINH